MKGERLIPVKSESELRVGMIVVLTGCRGPYLGGCGRPHRSMLLARDDGWDVEAHKIKPCWRVTGLTCAKNGLLAVEKAIPEGRLFRVDDRMDAELRSERREIYRTILDRAAKVRS